MLGIRAPHPLAAGPDQALGFLGDARNGRDICSPPHDRTRQAH